MSGEDIAETGEESDVSSESQYEGDRCQPQTHKWQKAVKKGKHAREVTYICKGGESRCNRAIKSNEMSIQCEACTNWFHPSCQGLVQGAFEAITEYDLFWVCSECREQFTERQNLREQVKQDIKKVEAHIVDKVEKVRTLVENVIEKKVDDGLKKMEMKIGESSSALKKAVQEKTIDRSKNLIVHNLPECDSDDSKVRQEKDLAAFKKMASDLCGRGASFNVTQIFRLNNQQGVDENQVNRKPRLLLVKLASQEETETLLGERFGLKDAGYPNVYINKDLSKEEREKQWKLRQELKKKGRETHKIFRGRVIPRDQ